MPVTFTLKNTAKQVVDGNVSQVVLPLMITNFGPNTAVVVGTTGGIDTRYADIPVGETRFVGVNQHTARIEPYDGTNGSGTITVQLG